MNRYPWAPEQEKFILDNYLLMTRKDIAKKFGCGVCVIDGYYERAGLVVPKAISLQFKIAKMTGRTTFSVAEDQYIKEHYLDMAYSQIGKVLGRSDSGIRRRIRSLGLIIPKEIILQRIEDSRIKPGAEPPNKGKVQTDYMTAEAIARTIATRFKKGNIPPNAKERDGVITIRHNHVDRDESPYKFIRLSLGKWDLLHKVNWEKVNGPVPKGHCLWCRNDDTMNCDPDNWELITRKENRIRNSGTVSLSQKRVATYMATTSRKTDLKMRDEMLKHPELIKLKRNELLLNREIKKYER